MSDKNLPSKITSKSTALERLSPLQLYLQEIARYPLLSPEEEYELAVKHLEQNDIASAHRLVTSNLRLVVRIANEFKQAQLNLLDLIQEGNAGLMKAVKKFDPYKGVRLSSYASWWIRAFILKYIMENKSQVKIGTTTAQRRLFFRLKKEAETLLREYETVDSRLLAESLDVKEKEVIEMQKRLSGYDVSLDAPLSTSTGFSSDERTQGGSIAAEIVPADEYVATKQIKTLFKENLKEFEKTLHGRDLEVFKDRLMSETPLTLQEIGNKYGISRERVRQIEDRIVKRLKDFVVEKGQIDL
jgi:RNA polymerase sigma-32 factor